MTLELRETGPGDVEFVAARLTPADLESIAAETPQPPLEALKYSMGLALPHPYTIWSGLEPVGMIGINPEPVPEAGVRVGVVWCVVTTTLRKHRMAEFVRGSKRWIAKQMESWDVLHNIEDARNQDHLDWLEFCGFDVRERIESWGPKRLPFIHFFIDRHKQPRPVVRRQRRREQAA